MASEEDVNATIEYDAVERVHLLSDAYRYVVILVDTWLTNALINDGQVIDNLDKEAARLRENSDLMSKALVCMVSRGVLSLQVMGRMLGTYVMATMNERGEENLYDSHFRQMVLELMAEHERTIEDVGGDTSKLDDFKKVLE